MLCVNWLFVVACCRCVRCLLFVGCCLKFVVRCWLMCVDACCFLSAVLLLAVRGVLLFGAGFGLLCVCVSLVVVC